MFMPSTQSSFGSLNKKKKKKKKRRKSHAEGLPFSPSVNGYHHLDVNHNSEKSANGKDVCLSNKLPQEDIRFVFPRDSSPSSNKQIPFLLPGQKVLLDSNVDDNDKPQLAQYPEKKETITTDETIDDIFGSGSSAKKKKSKDKVKSKLKTDDDDDVPLVEKYQESKLQHVGRKDSENKKSNATSNLKQEGKTKNGTNETQQHTDKIIIPLARSVQDAVNDKIGRRPRANSTDGELNLPQHGLCDERLVQLSHRWDLNRLYSSNGSRNIPPPRGLVNLGNTCFLNATLQCLVYMPSFCQSIVGLPSSCYESNRHGQRITMMLRGLLRAAHGIVQIEKNEPPRTKPFAPKNIFKAITSCKINGHRFRAGRQEDAHELLGKYS